jgi:hypothetical protein
VAAFFCASRLRRFRSRSCARIFSLRASSSASSSSSTSRSSICSGRSVKSGSSGRILRVQLLGLEILRQPEVDPVLRAEHPRVALPRRDDRLDRTRGRADDVQHVLPERLPRVVRVAVHLERTRPSFRLPVLSRRARVRLPLRVVDREERRVLGIVREHQVLLRHDERGPVLRHEWPAGMPRLQFDLGVIPAAVLVPEELPALSALVALAPILRRVLRHGSVLGLGDETTARRDACGPFRCSSAAFSVALVRSRRLTPPVMSATCSVSQWHALAVRALFGLRARGVAFGG